jgi:hypothetical protein
LGKPLGQAGTAQHGVHLGALEGHLHRLVGVPAGRLVLGDGGPSSCNLPEDERVGRIAWALTILLAIAAPGDGELPTRSSFKSGGTAYGEIVAGDGVLATDLGTAERARDRACPGP